MRGLCNSMSTGYQNPFKKSNEAGKHQLQVMERNSGHIACGQIKFIDIYTPKTITYLTLFFWVDLLHMIMCSYYTFLSDDLFSLHFVHGFRMRNSMNFWWNHGKNIIFHHPVKNRNTPSYVPNFNDCDDLRFWCVVTTHFRPT